MKLLIILIICIAVLIPLQSFGEKYYYIPDHKLETPPIFCAMDFEDKQLPDANERLMEITKDAINDWKTRLVTTTSNPSGWDFQFRKIPIDEQQELFFDVDCTVNIYFERHPPEEMIDYSGYADSYLTFSDIRIFYLEPVFEFKGKTEIINGEEWEVAEITGFKNQVDYYVPDTLRHEIGHSLGLDHPKFEEKHFVKTSPSLYKSPSIMVDPYDLNLDGDIDFEITDYDVRSVVNLYGEDGINEFNFLANFGMVIIVLFVIGMIVLINRKFRKKDPDLIPLDD